MGANSKTRKILKSILYPLTNERTYKYVQALSKAMDIRNGKWKEPELDLLPIALRKGETALDIGANFGLYAYHMGRAVGEKGKVFSFEPVPFTYETLSIVGKILHFDKSVDLVPKGCSDVNGKIKFSVPVQESGAFAAGQAYIGDRNDDHQGKDQQIRWSGTKEVVAEVVRLDDYLPEIADLPLIKADIEGAELLCFHGAQNTIAKHLPTTICEINPWFLDGFGIELNDLLDFFFSKGYGLFSYDKDGERPSLQEVSTEKIIEGNYLFLHPARQARFSSLIK